MHRISQTAGRIIHHIYSYESVPVRIRSRIQNPVIETCRMQRSRRWRRSWRARCNSTTARAGRRHSVNTESIRMVSFFVTDRCYLLQSNQTEYFVNLTEPRRPPVAGLHAPIRIYTGVAVHSSTWSRAASGPNGRTARGLRRCERKRGALALRSPTVTGRQLGLRQPLGYSH